MNSKIYDKSEKGREEIATRKYRLAPRLRTLLVMIDGRQTAEELLSNVGYLGLQKEQMSELINQQFVIEVDTKGLPVQDSAQFNVSPTSPPLKTTPQIKSPPARQPEVATTKQLNELRQFYTDTIKNNIGLRGYTLQAMVDRAKTLEDYADLKDAYLEVLTQARGKDLTKKLSLQLDRLLLTGNASLIENSGVKI